MKKKNYILSFTALLLLQAAQAQVPADQLLQGGTPTPVNVETALQELAAAPSEGMPEAPVHTPGFLNGLQALPNQTVCHGQSAGNIAITSLPGTSVTMTWTNSNPAIGLPASGTGALPAFTTINTTASPVTATINIKITTSGTTQLTTFTITVLPKVVVVAPNNRTVCAGSVVSGINSGVPATAGATISWTNDNPAIGLAASGTGELPVFTAVNTTGAPITAQVRVNASNGCSGAGFVFTITVQPRIVFNMNVPAVVVCGGTLVSGLSAGLPANSGATITWTNTNTAIGLAASGTGEIPAFTAVNNGTTPLSAIITVNASNSCSGAGKIFVLTVNPKLRLNAISSKTVCAGATVTGFATGLSGMQGVSVTWTNNKPSIGLPAQGTGDIPAFTAINNSNQPITATIAYQASNNCSGAGTIFTVTVLPRPVVNSVADAGAAGGQMTTSIGFSGNLPANAVVYQWTNSNPSIGLAASGTGAIPSFRAVNPSRMPVTATITVTPVSTTGGCAGTAKTFTFTVMPPTIGVQTGAGKATAGSNEQEGQVNDWQASVFPNPAAGDFTVQVQGTEQTPGKVSLRTGNGKVVSEQVFYPGKSGQVHFSGKYAPGMYYVDITQGTRHASIHLVMVR